MLFDDIKDQGFCESQIWGKGNPEYINSFSSLHILWIGLVGVFGCRYKNDVIMLIFCFLVMNGISSFGFHWTLKQGWGLLDTITMTVPAYLGMLMVWVNLMGFIVNIKILSRTYRVFILCVSCALAFALADRCLDHFIGFETVIGAAFFVILVGVGIQIAFLSVISSKCCCSAIFMCSNADKWDKETVTLMRNYLIGGAVSVFSTSLLWMLTEPYCYEQGSEWLAKWPTHALWHIFVSYGFYLVAVVNLFIYFSLRGVPYKLKYWTIFYPRFIQQPVQLGNNNYEMK